MLYRDSARSVGWLLLACGIAFAQYPGQYPPVGYPGSTYPPGQYPNGRGQSIPLPSKSGSKSKDQNAPMPNFRGTLKLLDDKTISIELADHRVLQFKRTGKTKFFRNGEELKTPQFAVGDQISVEGPEDAEGFLTAVNVYWEKAVGAATSTTAQSGDDGKAVDAWKDEPKAAATADAHSNAPQPATEVAPPSAKPDPDDPGRPKLQRGRPADPTREHAADVPEQPAPTQSAPAAGDLASAGAAAHNPPSAPSPSILRGSDDIPVVQPTSDPLIRKATEAALDFTETLPDYFCQEMMARYQSESSPPNWQPLDVLSTTVVYEKGKEDYRDVTVNGKPVKKNLEEVGGAWSTGEFGTILIDLFSPATAADFRYTRDSRASGVNAKVFDFSVARERSGWKISMGGQSFLPPYKGSVWIDPATGRVLRIEMQAYGFPDEFPTDHVETATDYQYTRLGDNNQYLLPVHAETLSCQRGSNFCSHNVIDFRNYHKYTGQSSITFGDIKK